MSVPCLPGFRRSAFVPVFFLQYLRINTWTLWLGEQGNSEALHWMQEPRPGITSHRSLASVVLFCLCRATYIAIIFGNQTVKEFMLLSPCTSPYLATNIVLASSQGKAFPIRITAAVHVRCDCLNKTVLFVCIGNTLGCRKKVKSRKAKLPPLS